MPVAVCAAVCVYRMSMRPPKKKTNRHEWSESENEEAKYQVAEPENEPAHVSCPSSAWSTLGLSSPFATAVGAVSVR